MTTVALGYAFYNHDVLHIQNVIEEADQMMYLNKNSEKFSHYEKRYVFSLFLLEFSPFLFSSFVLFIFLFFSIVSVFNLLLSFLYVFPLYFLKYFSIVLFI